MYMRLVYAISYQRCAIIGTIFTRRGILNENRCNTNANNVYSIINAMQNSKIINVQINVFFYKIPLYDSFT